LLGNKNFSVINRFPSQRGKHFKYKKKSLELNLTKTCFINFSINKSSPIGNNCFKAHQNNCDEFNINTVIAISNDSRCNCTTIYPVQKVKYLGITIDANLKWQDRIINTTRKIRLSFYKFKTL